MWRSAARTLAVVASLLAILPPTAAAQELAVHGQVRPRTEIRDLGTGFDRTAFTSMRVRADLLARMDRGVRVFIQLQDVRLWGEETSTLTDFSADHLDLHQGFVQIALGGEGGLEATVGRQETNLGGQRLVGAVGWTPQGRAFDGVRLRSGLGSGSLDLLAYKLREGSVDDAPESDLFGAYAGVPIDDGNTLDLYLLYNGVDAALATGQATFGARLHGATDRLTYRGEVSLQRGERGGDDVSAYMVGARLGTAFAQGRGALSVWYDHLSGNDGADGEVGVFDTLFGTNHKFYGFADLFLNIPADTGGQGLRDAVLKVSYEPREATRLAVDLHHFDLAEQGTLASRSLGQELDFTLDHRYSAHLGLTAGHSIVFAGEALEALGRARGTVHFGYLMLTATF